MKRACAAQVIILNNSPIICELNVKKTNNYVTVLQKNKLIGVKDI